MALEGEYNAALLSELLLEKLKTGSIPTLSSIVTELEALQAQYPTLGQEPLFSIEKNDVEFYENASASKTNSSLERYAKDVRVLWSTISEVRDIVLKNSQRWTTSYASTKRFLESLEDRIDNLLLLNTESLGYFQYVSDDFSTLDYVDLDNTNASIDTATGIVSLNETTSASDDYGRINTAAIRENDLTFSVVSATDFESSSLAIGSALKYALTDEYTAWLSYVKVGQQAPVTASLKVDLKETHSVNKIVFKLNGSTLTSAVTVTAMYSTDGVDFLVVPTDGSSQSILDTATWVFPTIDARVFKFLLTKNGADDKDTDTYTYEFGAKNISFYGTGYETETGSTVTSTSRQVLDENGELVQFEKIALSVCEQIPPKTSIHYYASVDGGITYMPIDPLERANPSRPQIIDFSNAVFLDNTDSTSLYDNTVDWDFLVPTSIIDYTKYGDTDEILNWHLPAVDVDNLKVNTITVYRNVGSKSDTTTLVRNVLNGWGYDSVSNTYFCTIYVDSPDGLVIDFGTTTINIDGAVISGTYTIKQGLHTVVTAADNWLNVTGGANSIDDLKANDYLYPYNHKLLIGGYAYGSLYEDEQIYVGASFFAERTVTYDTVHNFNTQIEDSDMGIYTYDLDANNNLVFIVKVDRTYSDHFNERFLVEYKLADKTFTDVIVKAVLNTTDSSVSPLLDAYTVKLG